MLGQDQYEYILLDVRSLEAYEKDHLVPAVNVPFSDIESYMPCENMFEKIYVYGFNGRTARRAANILSLAGYFNVIAHGSYRSIKNKIKKGGYER